MADRPSRQDLVLAPQTSNLRFALTAAGCACVGFGIVWAGLVVRGSLRDGDAPSSSVLPSIAAEPGVLPTPVSEAPPLAESLPHSRYEGDVVEHTASINPGLEDEDLSRPDQRYANRGRFGGGAAPTSPAFIDTSVPAVEAMGRLDDDLPAGGFVDAVESASGSGPTESESADQSDDALSDDAALDAAEPQIPVAPSDPISPDSIDSAPIDPPADATGRFQSPEPLDDGGEAARDESAAHDSLPEDFGDIPAPLPQPQAFAPAGTSNPLRQRASPPPGISTEAAPVHPFAASPVPVSSPAAARASLPGGPPPSVNAEGRSAGFADPSGPEHDDGAPVPAHALPAARTGNALAPVGMPFASAPPIGSPAAVPGSAGALPGSPITGGGPRDVPPPTPTGQGRPGAIQLEGVQTPQLAVEKRGPREIQVGKTARFEILVRNVGSAIANDVVLRDSVPFGTALVATTPPATPLQAAGVRADAQGASGDLVWQLGTLPPGGQARVALDLMPMQEGDVGSVASVSFRADASVRARATRPALQIAAEPPEPVLVGRDSRLTITIANPGSGIATGVVLEGLLPEGLTHRAGHELEFDVGSLPPGESRTIDLVLATTGPGVHALKLTARADGQIEVNEAVKIAVTAPTLELAVQMPSRRYLQRPATCVLSMTNAGTAPAVGVELVAQLPPGMKFIRANNAGYYEERNHRVLWNLEELPAAETGQVEVVVMPIALGPQKIVAAARTTAGLSDQIAHTVEVEGLAALAFEVADSEDPIEVGGVSEYVIRVANQGTKPASGVRVVATLLGDMEPVEARGPSPHRVDNLTVSFEPLAKLAPSEEATYRIRVRGRREGDQRVQVQLTSDEQPAPITKEEITRVYADR